MKSTKAILGIFTAPVSYTAPTFGLCLIFWQQPAFFLRESSMIFDRQINLSQWLCSGERLFVNLMFL